MTVTQLNIDNLIQMRQQEQDVHICVSQTGSWINV